MSLVNGPATSARFPKFMPLAEPTLRELRKSPGHWPLVVRELQTGGNSFEPLEVLAVHQAGPAIFPIDQAKDDCHGINSVVDCR